MILFIISNDIIIIYFNWDYLGIISYLLINWWSNKINGGLKSIIFNRLGDLSFLFLFTIIYSLLINIGIYITSSINLIRLLINIINNILLVSIVDYLFIIILIISIELILFTKSAQLPFSSWLLNAMNAPTPISALLHSSTMVIAGLYIGILISNSIINSLLIINNYLLINLLSTINYYLLLFIISLFIIIPLFTLFYSLIKAVISSDIKSIIALSTISQLSYMFIVLLINPLFTLYHIIIHSLFKSLLFILTGSLIHFNLNYQIIYKMKLSINFILILFILSLLVLVFSLSKELIINTILINLYYSIIYLLLIIYSLFTILYSIRLILILIN